MIHARKLDAGYNCNQELCTDWGNIRKTGSKLQRERADALIISARVNFDVQNGLGIND